MDEDKIKQLSAAMAIKEKLAKKEKVSAFKVGIFMESDFVVSGGIEFSRVCSELLGKRYDDWFDETSALVEPIVVEQTLKLNRILCDFFKTETKSVEIYPTVTAETEKNQKEEK